MSPRSCQAYRIADRTVLPEFGIVLWDGGEEHLEPKVADVLDLLIHHRDMLVTHNEILDAVWQRRIGADSSVTRAISLIRKALGDDSRTQAVIATVPKRGYRLTAEVEILGPGATHAGAAGETGRNAPPRGLAGFITRLRQRRVTRMALAYGVIAIILIQSAQVLVPVLGLPRVSLTILVVVLASGFPVALVLAWLYKVTPTGFEIDARKPSAPPRNESER